MMPASDLRKFYYDVWYTQVTLYNSAMNNDADNSTNQTNLWFEKWCPKLLLDNSTMNNVAATVTVAY